MSDREMGSRYFCPYCGKAEAAIVALLKCRVSEAEERVRKSFSAILAEREACAKIAEAMGEKLDDLETAGYYGSKIAAAIRARGGRQ